ncbi:MAG: aldo/keto reductase [Bacteroidales bacterium]
MGNNITRRDFFKVAGAGSLILGGSALGCAPSDRHAQSKEDTGIQGKMEYRINPKNGDKISLLGYGCMRWPMIKGSDDKDVIDQETVNQLVDYAWKHGVNYYDTSPAYLRGQSEKAAGIALSRYPRDSYYLATKLSNFNAFTRESSQKMYNESFEQLQTSYFDYYLLHAIGGGGYDAFKARYLDNGILDFLLKEREAGRIRNLGFSFHGTKDSFDQFLALDDTYHWDFIQIEMNYLDWRHAVVPKNVNADYLYEQVTARNIPVVVMEPLLGGRLANVPDIVADRLKEKEPQKSIASWAFRFVGSHPNVITALSGMTAMEPLEDNLKTFSGFKPLNDDETEFLMDTADLMATYPTVPCNDCQYCMPCPYGIDIPGIFKHYNNCVNGGLVAQSKEQADYKKLRRAYLVSYDRAIDTIRQADHCISCKQCVSHCPQSIEIPKELSRINRYVEKLKTGEL